MAARVGRYLRHLLLPAMLLLPGAGSAGVSLQWQNAESSVDQHAMTVLADSRILSDFVSLVDKNFDMDPSLVIVIGASEGPSMDTSDNVLNLPNGYLSHAIKTQAELTDDREEALERALDVVEYTLYHLLGHALLGSDSTMPDDWIDDDWRVEALSTWVVLSYWPNGGEQWYADVSAFAEASQRLNGPLTDFWQAHALYRSREERIKCWISGKGPNSYLKPVPAEFGSESRRRRCVASWKKINAEAIELLDGVLKPDAPLRARFEQP